ncbi:Hsp20/alpha crystallin family protein [Myxosarcina sp. GI1]|uniref:Hsp20/alpha crystallin family protein n=1 Tax=Myxosarcina sp. GI1 TaxID=1541065 RepID=UPI000568DAC5|nr:Hsp20/alpha crystallin family protein [Myxosarcina sp. GI1]
MALIRWQPYSEMDSLQREMNRLFDRLTTANQRGSEAGFLPPAEMSETPDAIHLKLEVPGMDAKDIEIQVSADSVAISGERKSVSRTNAESEKRSEFRYGSFRRVIPLKVRVQNNNVSAEYKDGILHLTLPKAEEEKNKVVKVNIG